MPHSTSIKHLIIFIITILAVISILLVLAISIGGFYSDLNWRLAWYSNPRPHFVMASGVALIWFLWRRNRLMSGVSLLTGSLNLFVLVPFFIGSSSSPVSDSTLTIAHLNTNRGQAVLSDLSDVTVDILLLQEVTPELADTLSDQFTSYELVHSHPMTGTIGSAVLIHKESLIEITHTEIIYLPDKSVRPLIAADVQFGDKLIKLLSLHIIRPHHEWADNFQKVELEAVAAWSREMQQIADCEMLIVGDFNVTPWSDRFFKLLDDGQLNDSLLGYGLQNTWPSDMPNFLGIPIDHAIHSDGLTTVDRSTVMVRGTDHTSLQITLALSEL